MKNDGLRPVAEEDDEAARRTVTQPLHHGAKSTGRVACGYDFIELESRHWDLLVGLRWQRFMRIGRCLVQCL